MNTHTPKFWSEMDSEKRNFFFQSIYALIAIALTVPIAMAIVKMFVG